MEYATGQSIFLYGIKLFLKPVLTVIAMINNKKAIVICLG